MSAYIRTAAIILVCTTAVAAVAYSQPRKGKRGSEPRHLYQVSARDEQSGEKKIGFIDNTGKLVIGFDRLPPGTMYAADFHEGRAVIYVRQESGAEPKGNMNHAVGYIDEAGEVVIPPRFNLGRAFSEGLAYVEAKDFRGFIDRHGKVMIKLEVDESEVNDFHQGLAAVGRRMTSGEWGFIDRSGKWKIRRQYDFADDFSEGLAGVAVNGKYGFINRNGEMVIPPRFDVRRALRHPNQTVSSGRFSEGLACVRVRGLYGYINKTGDFVIPPQFSNAQDFSEGLAWVTTDGKPGVVNKVGWIDKSGRWVVTEVNGYAFAGYPQSVTYANAYLDWKYSDGLVHFVMYSGNRTLHGYMNQRGEVVVKPREFGKVGPFVGGVAWVAFNVPGDSAYQEDYGYIDKQGQFIWRSK